MRRRKKNGFGRKKRNRILRKLIKLGLILALIFMLLSIAIDIIDTLQNEWDIFIKRHYQQASNIQLLQEELDILKSKNIELSTEVNLNNAAITNQNELINDIKESLNSPVWSNEGVVYQYSVIESNKNYEVLEFEEVKEIVPAELPGFFSPQWMIPIIIAGGAIIKGVFTRGIPLPI